MIHVLATMMSLVLADPPPPSAKPSAMVMDLKGRVEVKSAGAGARTAKVGDLLRLGDRLIVPADGGATLAFLGIGARERLKAGSEATVGPEGCAPASAVAERRKHRPAVSRTMRGVRPASGDIAHAAAVGRGADGDGEPPPAIEPIQGATVADDRPAFAWPAAKGAKGYRVRLLAEGSGRLIWQAETTGPKLAYPEGASALGRGYVYRWVVTDTDSRPVVAGRFVSADDSERRQLEELKPLADSDDRADLLAAALSYRRLKCDARAIAAFERLAKMAPKEPFYRNELADLYRRAGRDPESGRRKD